MLANSKCKAALSCLVVLAISCTAGFARDKNETIDATAYGTSTQLVEMLA